MLLEEDTALACLCITPQGKQELWCLQVQGERESIEAIWQSKLDKLKQQHQASLAALNQRLDQQDAETRSSNLSAEQYKAE